MTRRVIAREWLIFVGLLAFGFIVVPVVQSATVEKAPLAEFYNALVDPDQNQPLAWSVVLGPYVLVQLTRSVIWAVRTAGRKDLK